MKGFAFVLKPLLTLIFKPRTESTHKLTKKMRQRKRRLHRRSLKILFAAMHYLRTSRDGAVIARLVGVDPIELYDWSQQPKWLDAIRYWQPDYKGDGELEGDYFTSVVSDSKVKLSLEKAERMWTALRAGRDTYELREFFRRFEPSEEEEFRKLLRYEKVDFSE